MQAADVGWNWRWRRAGAMAVCGIGLWGLVSCAPAFNWRQTRLEGSGVQVLLPCKPESAQRPVALAGHSVPLSLSGCEVGDLSFVVGALRLPDGLTPPEAAVAWEQASAASARVPVGATQPWAAAVARLPAGTSVRGWQAQGVRSDGRAVRIQAMQVLRATEVVQLVLYGPAPAEVAQTLWEGVSVDAAP